MKRTIVHGGRALLALLMVLALALAMGLGAVPARAAGTAAFDYADSYWGLSSDVTATGYGSYTLNGLAAAPVGGSVSLRVFAAVYGGLNTQHPATSIFAVTASSPTVTCGKVTYEDGGGVNSDTWQGFDGYTATCTDTKAETVKLTVTANRKAIAPSTGTKPQAVFYQAGPIDLSKSATSAYVDDGNGAAEGYDYDCQEGNLNPYCGFTVADGKDQALVGLYPIDAQGRPVAATADNLASLAVLSSGSAKCGKLVSTDYGAWQAACTDTKAQKVTFTITGPKGSIKAGSTTFVVPRQAIYRLYNKHSGEHLYTSSAAEKASIVKSGWSYEGVGWYAPTSGTPVYRLFNPHTKGAGSHYYTKSPKEAKGLVAKGWKLDNKGKPVFHSGGAVKVFVAYNKHTGAHNYTKNATEQNSLVKAGWVGSLAFYAIK